MTNYAKRFLVLAFAIASVAAAMLPATASHAATTNSLIKGSGATVYWYANDGKRYVFPNIKTFWSWYPTSMLSSAQTLTDTQLSAIALGGNVTYRPGYKLIKVTTDPKVYAVSRYGVLRWISNETVAQQLYGYDWASKIEDVPDAFFTNYTTGSPIYSTSDYNVSNEYNGVSSPSDSLSTGFSTNNSNTNYYNTNFGTGNYNYNGQVGVMVSKTNVNENEYITVTATTQNGNSAEWIYVYDERTNALLQTCNNASTCTFTDKVTKRNNQSTYRYYVTAKTNGNWTTGYSYTLYINGGTNTTSDGSNITGTMGVKNTYTSNNIEYSTLYVDVYDSNNSLYNNNNSWNVNLVDQNENILKTCGQTTHCEISVALNPGETKTFYTNIQSSNFTRNHITSLTRTNQNTYNYTNGTVTNVNATVVANNCNQNKTVNATITTNGPTTVTYNWENPNGNAYVAKTLYFANAGTQTITDTWNLNDYELRLRVTSPNSLVSNVLTSYVCGNTNPNNGSASVSVTTDKTTVVNGQQVTITTYVSNSSFATSSLITKIYDERNNEVIAQCNASLNCSTTAPVSMISGLSNTTRFKAVVSDIYGNTVATGYSQYVTIQ